MEQSKSELEIRRRMKEVDGAFRPAGLPLSDPSRVLLGEGVLMKRGRKKWAPKAFFLYNDLLVYGSILMDGRWYKKQNIIQLQDIKLEDVEDFDDIKNQWLIRTPPKSFYVRSRSKEEKQAWMEHIEACKLSLLEGCCFQPALTYAMTWVPDQAAHKCMRCLVRFTTTNRRHHCRSCGCLVCNQCSKARALLEHIDPTRKVRVCKLCSSRDEDATRKDSLEDEDVSLTSSDEE